MEKKVPLQIQLRDKTLPQLLELLQSHEKVLSNKKLLASLPDKGQKIQQSVELIRKHISVKQHHEHSDAANHVTSDPSKSVTTNGQQAHFLSSEKQMDISADSSNASPNATAAVEEENKSSQPQIEKDSVSKPVDGKRTMNDHQEPLSVETDVSASLSEHLVKLQVSKTEEPHGGGEVSGSEHKEIFFPNSYENVMRRHADDAHQRERFKPNSSLNISDIHQLPEQYKFKSRTLPGKPQPGSSPTYSKDAESERLTRLKDRLKEDSAVSGPDYKFKSAKTISVEDSIKLQKQQRSQLEAAQMRHATERLAAQLNIKTVEYKPPIVDMAYRSKEFEADADDNESCGSHEDYPDD